MAWLAAAEGTTPLERALAASPTLATRFRDFARQATSTALVDPVVRELIRLRYAQLHGSESELVLRYQDALDAGLTEEKIAALENYYASDVFTEYERDCLEFAEQLSLDPHLVTDDHFARVGRARSDEEVLAFLCTCTTLDALSRLRTVLEVEPAFEQRTVVGRAAGLY